MNYRKSAGISFGITALFLSACGPADEPAAVSPNISQNMESTVKIMEDKHTIVAILLNKGGGMSVVNVSAGQEFTDCNRQVQAKHKTAREPSKECRPIDQVKVLGERKIELTVTEGSPLCLNIASFVGLQAACSPPLGNLPEELVRALLANPPPPH